MKKTILLIGITSLVFGVLLSSCLKDNEKVTKAEQKVALAKQEVNDTEVDLKEARQVASDEEWQQFKNDMDAVIDENDKRISELRLKIKKSGQKIDAVQEKNIAALEVKNKELKAKVATFNNDVNSDWQSFKREFNSDMKDLGNSLNNLTVDNKK